MDEIIDNLKVTLASKSRQYGDTMVKVTAILQILYPEGIKPEQYLMVSKMVRVLDKIARLSHQNQDVENDWLDIAGYAIKSLHKS